MPYVDLNEISLIQNYINFIFSTLFQHQDLDVSTTGSNRHVDLSCWAQILQLGSNEKLLMKNYFALKFYVYVDVVY